MFLFDFGPLRLTELDEEESENPLELELLEESERLELKMKQYSYLELEDEEEDLEEFVSEEELLVFLKSVKIVNLIRFGVFFVRNHEDFLG